MASAKPLSPSVRDRGLLLHITHYDPMWCARKARERAFALDVALKIVQAMAEANMNVLVVDCADGVAYASHPELRRRYTVEMGQLATLAQAARERGIEVVPKLNFSKSGRNHHDEWLRPYADPVMWTRDMETYWRVAGDLIAELVETCRPRRFFHIGMDEDHWRSMKQYVQAIKTLRALLRTHRLRAIVWNDSCHYGDGHLAQVHADKCRAAETLLPRDVLHVLWDYSQAHPRIVKRLRGEGREVWAAPGPSLPAVRDWRKALLSAAGQGLLMTRWVKCNRANRAALLKMVRELGPAYA